MELRDYLRLVRKQWMFIICCTTVTIGIAALLVLRTTPTYASQTTLFLSVTQSDNTPAGAYQGGLFSQQRAASYADLVRGEAVTRAVVQDLGLSMSPAALGAKITARVLPATVLLEITVTDTDPVRSQRLTGAVAEEFKTFVQELERPSPDQPSPIRATTIDTPTLPSSPVTPNPSRTISLGVLAGLVLGLAIAVLREVLDTSIKSADALAAHTGAPNLGVIAHDSDAQTNPLVVHIEPRSPRAEAFRQLRTNLQFVDVDRNPKRIVVTSSVPSEGKTTTTCNLGLTLAQAGQRVLLVEGDIRRPRLAEYLRLEGGVGLTNILIGRVAPDDAIQSWGDLPLQVLASGPLPPNPSELLQSRAMHQLLRELDGRADVVLIDAPPLLPVTDAALLARMSDGAVLVVRHGKTGTDQLETAIGNLAKVDARLLGSVLNMAPSRGPDAMTYGYGYGYGAEGGRRRSRAPGETVGVT